MLHTFRAHPNRYKLSCGPWSHHNFFKNHIVERIWVEINRRVNYPIKSCLITLQQAGDINIDCPHTWYCVSWFTIRVANVGTTIAVNSWNDHPIPGDYINQPYFECHYAT